MLLRSSISNTKKFFQKTLQNFKSFFSSCSAYHRLPKTHAPPPIDMDNIHSHPSNYKKDDDDDDDDDEMHTKKNVKKMIQKRENSSSSSSSSSVMREERTYVVERKLRELEMLDMGNVEYILDIQEVLHYYYSLTSPVFLDIVDSFFMQIYSDFFPSHF